MLERLGDFGRTLRGRILLSFLATGVITAGLGTYATLRIREAGELAGKTFDQSLMAVSYARAAEADFASMQAIATRQAVDGTSGERADGEKQLEDLRRSLDEDLSIAGARSQSARAAESAKAATLAVAAWQAARRTLAGSGSHDQDWRSLDDAAAAVDTQIELLVNYTAGDGFLYRQSARHLVAADIRANIVGTALALILSAVVAWLLARRIIGPVAVASSVAGQIAQGELECAIPKGNGDELGALLAAMGVMRDNLRRMMEREVAQRRSAQTRLADALDSSEEGIVVVDAAGEIAMANRQVSALLDVPASLVAPGTPIAVIESALQMSLRPAAPASGTPVTGPLATELCLGGDRWLRVSGSSTQDGGLIAIISDLTPLKLQENKLRGTNASFDAALENMSQGLCLYDADGRLKVFNRRFHEIFRLDPASLSAGLTFEQVFALKVAAGNYEGLDLPQLAATRLAHRRSADGAVLEELAHGHSIAIVHRDMREGGWVTTYEDVTERRAAEKQVRFLAQHDALTGLPNRTLFGERLNDAFAQLAQGARFAVLCLDLDRFKNINDTLGHPTGDALLQVVAARLLRCVRSIDTVARLGGDEFAVIQASFDRPEDTFALARRIVEALSAPFQIDGQVMSIGVSIGLATAPADGHSPSTLLKNADAALYRAKEEGRGTWRCFEQDMDLRLQARRALEADLRTGLAEGQFEVHYQPFYDLARDRICGFEALVRWNHPVRGQVPPSDFIVVAEEIGLIVPLGEWVLDRACHDARVWPPDLKVAVNVSPAQFGSPTLVETVREALDRSGLPPHRLELEITETVLLSNTSLTLDVLHELRAMGIQVAMDDFGTGYSSLSYLRRFPVDRLKIDRSFVQDVTTSADSGAILRAILALASSLGLSTTAEGVETSDQLNRLRAEGCDEVQGFYFSKPVPLAAVPGLLARWPGRVTAAA